MYIAVIIEIIIFIVIYSPCSNALSRKNIGGAYGGADFNPYSKSETEIQRFCQSFMTELSKYIGPDVDLPGTYIIIYLKIKMYI